ncbi:Uncharacterized protein APZ42_024562 [Daphnia magna]|uniref:Helix-turn-helix domain-containing protein n=1 Tax=Daphnia magna TaxID=35525 RepID=A0A164TZ89_9CRUS|nr:Uncharacterized protein APZ42_024562 [Daphnia magna]
MIVRLLYQLVARRPFCPGIKKNPSLGAVNSLLLRLGLTHLPYIIPIARILHHFPKSFAVFLYKNMELSTSDEDMPHLIYEGRMLTESRDTSPLTHISQTFPGRPIVATFTSGTYLLDKFITELTAPLLPRIPGSLVDTNDLLDKLPKHRLPEGTLITTMDVNSLYPNIPWGPGMEAAASFYTNNLEFLRHTADQNNLLRPPSPALFKRILSAVLCNSIINFKDKRPPDWLITFQRFIDDILIISNHTEPNALSVMIESITTEHITYTHTQPSQSDNFLDITIHLETSTSTLVISPFTKETASGAYLHPASNHPGHVLSAIPYSQFLRLRRNSSTIEIFIKHTRRMMKDFKNMTYDKKLLKRSYNKALRWNSAMTSTTRQTYNSAFRLITTFNKYTNWKLKSHQLKSLYNNILDHYSKNGPFQNWKHVQVLQAKRPTIVFTNGPSINSRFSGQIKKPRDTHPRRTQVNMGLTSTQHDTSQPGGNTQASTALTPRWNSPTQTSNVSDQAQQINLDLAAHIVETRQGNTNSSTIQRILDRGLASRQGSLDWSNTYLRRKGKTLKEYYMLTPTQPKHRGTILYNGNTAYHFSRIAPASSQPFRPIYKILSQTGPHDWISIGREDFELLEPLVPTAKHLAALSALTQQ